MQPGPVHSLRVPGLPVYIRVGVLQVFIGNVRLALQVKEDLHGHGPAQVGLRRKGGAAGALHQAVFIGVPHGLHIPPALFHISKGQDGQGLVPQLVHGHGAGDLAGGQEQGLPVGALLPIQEQQPFRGHVAAGDPLVQLPVLVLLRALNNGVKVPGVDVVDKGGTLGVGHVVDHDAAGALQGHKGVGPAVYHAHGDALRLRALFAGAVVQHGVVVGGVVVIGHVLGGEGFKIAAAGEHLRKALLCHLEDGKGPAAEEIVRGPVQAVEVLALKEHNFAGKARLPGDGPRGRDGPLVAEVHLFLV